MKINDIFMNEAATIKAASFILDPALNPDNYVMTNSLRNVEKWKAMTYAGDSRNKKGTMGGVGYIMISKTSNRIIPISHGDEHHHGFDMLRDLVSPRRGSKQKSIDIDLRDYVPVWSGGSNYIYNTSEIPLLLNIFTKFLAYGGKDGILEGSSSLSGNALHLSQFVASKGFAKIKPGELAPLGQKIVKSFANLAKALATARDNPHQKSALVIAGKAALECAKTIDDLGWLAVDYYKLDDIRAWPKEISEFVKSGDVQGLEKMFFGFHGIKNQMHSVLREYDPKSSWGHSKKVFGDIPLAIDMLGLF